MRGRSHKLPVTCVIQNTACRIFFQFLPHDHPFLPPLVRASMKLLTIADLLAAQNSSSVYLNSTVRSCRAAMASHKVGLISGESLVTRRHSAVNYQAVLALCISLHRTVLTHAGFGSQWPNRPVSEAKICTKAKTIYSKTCLF